jgi:hypothetical protein
MTRIDLAARWSARRDEFARWALTADHAKLCAEFLADLQVLWAEDDREWITGVEASRRTGLDQSSLRRKARQGLVTAEKRGRAWWFRAGSLSPKSSRGVEMVAFDPAKAADRALERATRRGMDDNDNKGDNGVGQKAA